MNRRFLLLGLLSLGVAWLLVGCGGGGDGLLAGRQPSTEPIPATLVTSTRIVTPKPSPTPAARLLFALPASGKAPLDWATQLVKEVAPADTSYDHAGSVSWQGISGATKSTSHTDCSGLVNGLLSQSYGLKDEDFRRWLSDSRPLAKDYFTAIQSQRGFTSLSSVADLKPGDFIAVRYLNSAPGDDTGHIMLVVDAPTAHVASAPLQPNSQQWDVTVIDSADSGHGPADTRALSGGKSREGLGRGVLRLYADPANKVIGYSWSDLKESDFYGAAGRPIVLGRLDPSFKL